jgi:hypothetical protein
MSKVTVSWSSIDGTFAPGTTAAGWLVEIVEPTGTVQSYPQDTEAPVEVDLPPGPYTVKVSRMDSAGNALKTVVNAFVVPELPQVIAAVPDAVSVVVA